MIKQLLDYKPKDEYEIKDKTYMLELYEMYGEKLFSRFKFFHFTASAVVFNKTYTKVLFIYHKIYNSWSWMGGHMDGSYDFIEVSKKEVKEESGIKNLELIYDYPVSIEILPVWPHVKDKKYISSHQHLNITYAYVSDESEKLIVNSDETRGVKWVLIEELDKHVTEKGMLPVYERIIKRVVK